MIPALARAQAWAVVLLRRAGDLARRYPVRAVLLLPALVLLYVLVVIEMILGLILTSLAITGFTGMLNTEEDPR